MAALCHCSMCRRASAAPAVAWAMYPQAQVTFLQGEPASYASSAEARRGFCGRCGTQVCFTATLPARPHRHHDRQSRCAGSAAADAALLGIEAPAVAAHRGRAAALRGVSAVVMPIGKFARACRLSVKALRHYDEEQLLRPAHVDERTGYRYYTREQVRDAVTIGMLRGLGIGIPDHPPVPRRRTPPSAPRFCTQKRERIEREMAQRRFALDAHRALRLDGHARAIRSWRFAAWNRCRSRNAASSRTRKR